MKFKLIITLALLLGLGVGMPMLMPGPDGKPMMTGKDWLPDSGQFNQLIAKAKKLVYSANDLMENETGVNLGASRGKIYKWQDEHGTWHFSDTASDKIDAANQMVEAMPQIRNSMQSPPKIDFGDEKSQISNNVPNIPLPTTIPLAKIPKLIDDAKNVQKLADERAKRFDNL